MPRRRHISRAAVSLVVLGLALALGGCRDGGPHPLVFSVGGAPAEVAVWEQVAQAFTDSTDIPVEILRQPANTSQQRQALIVSLGAGLPDPDVFLMDVAWVALFADAHWLHPIAADTAAFFSSVLDAVDRRGDDLVALPVYLDAGLLYYRRDLLAQAGIAEPPATFAALRDDVRRVRDAGHPHIGGYVWQGAQYEGLVVNFLEFAGRAGGLVAEDGGWRVDLPANRQALQLMRDLVTSGVSPASTTSEMREEEVRAAFQHGDAVFERNWPYAWALHQQEGSPVRGGVAVASLPGPSADTATTVLGGWHAGISRFSDRADDAARFVAFITSRAVQTRLVRTLGWNPGRRDLYDDAELQHAIPHLATLARVIAHATPRPTVPYYPQMSAILQRHLSAAISGRAAPADALRAAQAELDALARYYQASEGRDVP